MKKKYFSCLKINSLSTVLFIFILLIKSGEICFSNKSNEVNSFSSGVNKLTNNIHNLLFIDDAIKDKNIIKSFFDEEVDLSEYSEKNDKRFLIFSHGEPGRLLIDGKWLDKKGIFNWFQNLDIDIESIESISIYGCNFGSGEKGNNAVKFLKENLNIHIAASSNITGVNGDWNLEIGGSKVKQFNINSYNHNLQDNDGDSISNFQDLDDDNDGILDVNEGQCSVQVQTGVWTIVSSNVATYNLGGGVVVRFTKNVTNAISWSSSDNFNNQNFWSDPSWAGSPSLGGVFDFGNSLIVGFEDVNGVPVEVTNPILHMDRLGGRNGDNTQNSALVTLSGTTVDGNPLTWNELAGTSDFGTTATTARDSGAGTGGVSHVSESTLDDPSGTSAGSVQINGTLSTFTLSFPMDPAGPGTGTQDGIEFGITACTGVDTDLDGIPDHQDVDSDNDGCYDALEAGQGVFNIGQLVNGSFPVGSVNANGVPTAVNGGSGQATVPAVTSPLDSSACCIPTVSSAVDFDGDNVADVCDLDDDNDGILDDQECAFVRLKPTDLSSPPTANQVNYNVVNEDVSSVFGLPLGSLLVTITNASVNSSAGAWKANDATGNATFTFSGPYASLAYMKVAHAGALAQGSQDGFIATNGERFKFTSTSLVDDFVLKSGGNTFVAENPTGGSVISNGQTFEWTAENPGVQSVEVFSNGGTGNNQYFIELRLCDIDRDGILDHLDVDSDGDGCYDILETSGGFVHTAVPSGSFPSNDVNSNGVPNTVNGGAGQATEAAVIDANDNSACCDPSVSGFDDADGDGVANSCDLDNDNDGILDVSEAYCDQPEVANSESGLGVNQDKFYIFNWDGADFINGIQDGDSQTFNLSNGVTVVATISNAVGDTSSFVSQDLNTFAGAKFQNLYNTPGTNEAFYSSVNGEDVSFTITFTATISGNPYPLELLAFDAEETAAGAQENTIFITNGEVWRLVESGGGGTGDFSGEGTKTLIVNETQTGTSIYASKNTTEINVNINQGGLQAVAFGFRLLCDSDNDGIFNYLDTDSDNDGCFDALEADGIFTIADAPSGVFTSVNLTTGIPNDVDQSLGQATNSAVIDVNDSTTCCDANVSGFTDIDNDGIVDQCDEDSDNDGILDSDECQTTPANFVFNSQSGGTFSLPNSMGVANWTMTQTGGVVESAGTTDNDELYYVYNGNSPDWDLSATFEINSLPAGSDLQLKLFGFVDKTSSDFPDDFGSKFNTYTISWVGGDGNAKVFDPAGNQIVNSTGGELAINNGGSFTQTVSNDRGNGAWNNNNLQWYVVFPTGATQFTIEAVGGANMEGFRFSVDEKFCPDTDNDGTPNYRDLDSDNDGIYDVIESGVGSRDTDGDGDIDISDGSFVDANNNGVDDVAESTDPTDSDGDDVPDSLEIDSDGDGCNDAVEAGYTDTAPADGIVDGTGIDLTNGTVTGSDGYTTPADSDANSTSDFQEVGPDTDSNGTMDWCQDTDNDGIPNSIDVDDDNDGIPDVVEGIDDTDGDNIPDFLDLDSDNDGILDVDEGGNGDQDTNEDGVIDSNDTGYTDNDNDGQADNSVDVDEEPDTDNDSIPDYKDLDSDNDGINDVIENGNGTSDTNNDGVIDSNDTGGADTDGDGISDSVDGNLDPSNIGEGPLGEGDTVDSDGDGVSDYQDLDSDDDGVNDITEGGNEDEDGNGMVDGPDTDGDGIKDEVDEDDSNFGDSGNTDVNDSDPTDPDSGGDGTVPDSGTDADGDGIADSVDGDDTVFGDATDTDGDGIPDVADLDDDNDGIPDVEEGTEDLDNDGIPNSLDLDSDNDGVLDVDEGGNGDQDTNGDGVIDSNDAGYTDNNNDGQADDSVDENEEPDTDGDGIPDYKDLDSDNDGINDVIENGNGSQDTNNDGVIDSSDTGGADTDGDGISDSIDADVNPNDFGEGSGGEGDTVDSDGDGVPDYQDLDSDDDGVNDITEGGNEDEDGNGMVDGPDTDGDGIKDEVDEDDSNFGDNGNTDENDTDPTDPNSGGDGTVTDSGTDSDGDGIPDSVDGLDGFGDSTDTDGDGVPDSTDLDDDNDGIPDAEEGEDDTDGDGIPDNLDLDSDNDGVLDVDEGGNGDQDTNGDGVIDSNDDGYKDDNNDGQADDSVDENEEPDTDGDGVPDYKDLDSDNDGINDVIENGNKDADTNNDGVIDSNDTGGSDADEDGISDSVDSDPANHGEGSGGEGDTVDSDGDGVPDFKDLDSDDDGVNDITEGGNEDKNGDGMVDGPDNDGDGVVDDADGDGISDEADQDDVNFGDAGNTDENDTDPTDPNSGGSGVMPDSGTDADGDGISDSADLNDEVFGDAVGLDSCVVVYNEFTPNNDGLNDTLIINCLENYPNNRLEIFNRWGNTVYSKSQYDNSWKGESNGRVNVQVDEGLPSGTYYYVLDLGNGEKPKVGWIYINRK